MVFFSMQWDDWARPSTRHTLDTLNHFQSTAFQGRKATSTFTFNGTRGNKFYYSYQKALKFES